MNINTTGKKDAKEGSGGGGAKKKLKEVPKNFDHVQITKEEVKKAILNLVKQVKLPNNAIETLNHII